MPGDLSGTALPVYIPLITDIANIQSGLRNFYYGTASAVSDEGSIEAYSIAGRIKDLRDTKLNIASGTATTQLTISHATLPKLIFLRGANTTTIQNSTASDITLTLPASTGTFALTTESTMADLGTIASGSVATVALGSGSTSTFSIGTVARTGDRTINIGTGSVSNNKTINIGTAGAATTNVLNIGMSGATINTTGTLAHSGAATVSSTLGVTGAVTGGSFTIGSSSAPTITKGSADPSGTPQTGSLYIKTGVAYDDTLWSHSTSGWRKIRGNKWFSGTGAPGTLTGQQIGDFYLDRLTGKVYELA